MAEIINVNQLLDGQVRLEIECLDRIYLNAYVPTLQVGGQVVTFMTAHRGYPIHRQRCSLPSATPSGPR